MARTGAAPKRRTATTPTGPEDPEARTITEDEEQQMIKARADRRQLPESLVRAVSNEEFASVPEEQG